MRLAALPLALLLAACARTPSEPSEVCGACAPPGAVPPSADKVAAAVAQGRSWAAQTCQIRTSRPPNIEWRKCDFLVEAATTEPGGKPHPACCAGMTFWDGSKILVSMSNPSNTLNLVTWESRNYFWIMSGCAEQAYARR